LNGRYDALIGGANITYEPGAYIALAGFGSAAPTVNGNYGLPTSGTVNFIVDTNSTSHIQTTGGTVPAPKLILGQDSSALNPISSPPTNWGSTQAGAGPFAETLPNVTRIKLFCVNGSVRLMAPTLSGNAIWQINSDTPVETYNATT